MSYRTYRVVRDSILREEDYQENPEYVIVSPRQDDLLASLGYIQPNVETFGIVRVTVGKITLCFTHEYPHEEEEYGLVLAEHPNFLPVMWVYGYPVRLDRPTSAITNEAVSDYARRLIKTASRIEELYGTYWQ